MRSIDGIRSRVRTNSRYTRAEVLRILDLRGGEFDEITRCLPIRQTPDGRYVGEDILTFANGLARMRRMGISAIRPGIRPAEGLGIRPGMPRVDVIR